jgi:hypothetical protein
MLAEDFGVTSRSAARLRLRGRFPNDQPMFAFFRIRSAWRARWPISGGSPAWVTPSAGAAEFAELAEALIYEAWGSAA